MGKLSGACNSEILGTVVDSAVDGVVPIGVV